MQRYPITAKKIVSIGYDEENRILEIEFKHHVIHHYFEVPLMEFVALMKSENIDEFYLHCISCEYFFEII